MACGGSCDGCSDKCQKESLKSTLHKGSSVKKVVAVVSGKGGVGKSLVSCLLSCKLQAMGYKAALLDADVTGPSVPQAFGLQGVRLESGGDPNTDGSEGGYLVPAISRGGVQLVSMNFLLERESDPVVWRGPVISGAVRQFWSDVLWRDVDFMVVDCPPGTGDVPLTVFQSLPVDGIVVVSSPQSLVRTIVQKALNMAAMMGIPVLGLVENMSYVACPHCGQEIRVFGDSGIDEVAKSFGVPVLARIPMDSAISTAVDTGQVESLDAPFMDRAAARLSELLRE